MRQDSIKAWAQELAEMESERVARVRDAARAAGRPEVADRLEQTRSAAEAVAANRAVRDTLPGGVAEASLKDMAHDMMEIGVIRLVLEAKLTPEMVGARGTHRQLKEAFLAAGGNPADMNLLGNAKKNLFCRGMKWSRRHSKKLSKFLQELPSCDYDAFSAPHIEMQIEMLPVLGAGPCAPALLMPNEGLPSCAYDGFSTPPTPPPMVVYAGDVFPMMLVAVPYYNYDDFSEPPPMEPRDFFYAEGERRPRHAEGGAGP